ncbi:MAG: polyketide cyclase [Delftia acidovorans]|nr:polyketide cyclase [Delftia acidovorans]
MSHMDTDDAAPELVQEYALDAPPEKVWRALSIPELRAQWLPGTEHAEPLQQVPQQELRLRLREAEPPFLESTVDLQISPAADGGTLLRIVHVLTDARLQPAREAANDGGFLMYAT